MLYELTAAENMLDAMDQANEAHGHRRPLDPACDRSPNGAHHMIDWDEEFGDPDNIGGRMLECTWCGAFVDEVPPYPSEPVRTHYGTWSWQPLGLPGRPWIVRHEGKIRW